MVMVGGVDEVEEFGIHLFSSLCNVKMGILQVDPEN